MNKGFFRGLFDLNHDGKLDPLERAMDIYAFDQLMNDSDKENNSDQNNDSSDKESSKNWL